MKMETLCIFKRLKLWQLVLKDLSDHVFQLVEVFVVLRYVNIVFVMERLRWEKQYG